MAVALSLSPSLRLSLSISVALYLMFLKKYGSCWLYHRVGLDKTALVQIRCRLFGEQWDGRWPHAPCHRGIGRLVRRSLLYTRRGALHCSAAVVPALSEAADDLTRLPPCSADRASSVQRSEVLACLFMFSFFFLLVCCRVQGVCGCE